MRRAWKSAQVRIHQHRRTSCCSGQILQGNLLHEALYECSRNALALTSCSYSLRDSNVGMDITIIQTLLHPVAPLCSSPAGGTSLFSQHRTCPVSEYFGPLLRQETERNLRTNFGYDFRCHVDFTRSSGNPPSRGFYSRVKVCSAASYATASALERDFVGTSTDVPEDVIIHPSSPSFDLVDVTEPSLDPLELELTEEFTEELGNLSHVSNLEAKLRCLRDWGLTDEELAKLRLHVPSSVRSALLKNPVKKLIEVATFLVEECGVPKLKVADALLGNVFLASSRIEDRLRPKATYLLSLGITKEQVGKIIDRCPQILTYSMEQRVLPTERKLIECGLKMEDIGRAVVKCPGLLGIGLNKIDRTIEFLKAAGVVEIAKCISRHPQILSLSLDGKVHNMTAFLKSDLLLDTEIINKTISIQPSIFTYSVEFNLRPKVIYFLNLGLGRQEIGRMVAIHPAIMGHSLETAIKPKIDFLVNGMNRSVNEIVAFPQYLSYSLCSRIHPRYEFLAERGIFSISLSSMLSCRPDIFHKRYASGYEPPAGKLLARKLKSSSRQS